jgi:SOS regulatory protein LexA
METTYNLRMVDWHGFIRRKRQEYLDSPQGKGKTDAYIARIIGIPPTTWSNYYNSGFKPGVSNLPKLASFFGPEVYDALDLERPEKYKTSEGSVNYQTAAGINIPLLGRIAAGTAIPMPKLDFPPYGSEETIPVLRNWLPPNANTSNVFALEVEGDSMIEEGINDGDIIFMYKTNVAENGDLVAVRLDEDDSVTLKKFYRQNGTVILQPANSKMQPVQVNANLVHIEGKIVFSIHKWWK